MPFTQVLGSSQSPLLTVLYGNGAVLVDGEAYQLKQEKMETFLDRITTDIYFLPSYQFADQLPSSQDIPAIAIYNPANKQYMVAPITPKDGNHNMANMMLTIDTLISNWISSTSP